MRVNIWLKIQLVDAFSGQSHRDGRPWLHALQLFCVFSSAEMQGGKKKKKKKKKRTNKCITLPFCLSSLPRQSGMLFPQSKKASFGKDSRNLKACISNGAVSYLWASKQFMPRIVPLKEKRKNKERKKERKKFKKLISCGKSESSNQKGLIKLATNHRKRWVLCIVT